MKKLRLNRIIKYLTNSDYRFLINTSLGFHKSWSDERFLKKMYSVKMGEKLDLEHPQTFNEKLQWLKIYNRKPEYTVMVDKYKVREYIAEKLGEEYLIPLIGVWDNPDDIDFDSLPNQFVLKCNHNSGLGMCICKDKSKLDIDKVKADLRKGLKEDYYSANREWPYKDVPRKIICEQYMVDDSTSELRDYKFFCFNGMCKCFKVDFDRFVDHHANYYDPEGNLMKFGEADFPPNYDKEILLPNTLKKMTEFAEELSKGQPFMRADFYDVNGQIYFGEITFFPASGMGKFTPPEWDEILGKWVKLPEISGGGYALVIDGMLILLKEKKRGKELKDYKFWCFNGEPEMVLVCSERFSSKGLREDFYDVDWKHLPIQRPHSPNSEVEIACPKNFEKMKELARVLAINIPFVRIDFYEINDQIYFGEITFFPASGMDKFVPEIWDKKLGDRISL